MNIELFSIDELVEELAKRTVARHGMAMVLGITCREEGTTAIKEKMLTRGDHYACLGIATFLRDDIHRGLMEPMPREEDDEL